MARTLQILAPLIIMEALVVLLVLGQAIAFWPAELHLNAFLIEIMVNLERATLLAGGVGAAIVLAARLTGSSNMKAPRALIPIALLGPLAVLLYGLWPATQSRSEKPDIVLIVVDTLRKDYVTRERTPHILSLADDGLTFERAYANAPWTLPSFGSILTGRFPRNHGATKTPAAQVVPVREDAQLLSQALQDAGYQTVSITTNPYLGNKSGLARGFDSFRNLMRDDMKLLTTFPILYKNRFAPAPLQVERAVGWLKLRDRERPLFMLLHLMDPHQPWEPARWALSEEREAGAKNEVEAEYGAEVREVDRALGHLFEQLDLDRAWVVFTSDHGEGLEKGTERWGHGNTLFPELVRIPLIVRPPQGTEAKLCTGLVNHVDYPATLLSAVGVTSEFGQGSSMLEGTDCGAGRPYAFSSVEQQGKAEPRRLDSVVDPARAAIWEHPDSWTEYALREDPDYRAPTATVAPELSSVLMTHVNWLDKGASPAAAVELSPEELEQLKALGYIE